MARNVQEHCPAKSSMYEELCANGKTIDWENVIIAFLEHSSAPLIVLLIALMYKGDIKRLLSRLQNLRIKGYSVTFIQQMDKVEELANSSDKNYKAYTGGASDREDLQPLTQVRPAAAVVISWNELENSLVKLLPRNELHSLKEQRKTFGLILIKELFNRKLISKRHHDLLRELKKIRNTVVHSADDILTSEQAEKYVKIALFYADKFDKTAKRNSD